MNKRFELINVLNAHDNFKDNKYNKKLDSFDVVDVLNHYDKLQNILIERDKQISYLKAKLAEKDKAIENWQTMYQSVMQSCHNSIEEDKRLREQLAEKEEQVKQLKLDLGMYKSVNEFINSYGIEKAREALLQTEKTKKQDKISFAVEQLEKVKDYADVDYRNHCYIDAVKLDKFIDNQIEELKKEMK